MPDVFAAVLIDYLPCAPKPDPSTTDLAQQMFPRYGPAIRTVFIEEECRAGEESPVGADQGHVGGGKSRRPGRVEMRADVFGQEIGMPSVVGVEKRPERLACPLQAIRHRGELPTVLGAPKEREAGLLDLRQDALDSLGRAVRRTIVDDDAAKPWIGLGRDRADRGFDETGVVEVGYNDGDFGRRRNRIRARRAHSAPAPQEARSECSICSLLVAKHRVSQC